MVQLEDKGIVGIKGLIFDCYNTLIDIRTDEDSMNTFEILSRWLIYHGIKIAALDLMKEYKHGVKDQMEKKWEAHPEVKVEEVFGEICRRYALWDIDETNIGEQTAKAFRAASLRRLQIFPQSLRLLNELENYPKAIVSNGQRVFSEPELRYFGLPDQFNIVIFSSDFGHKKPDPRIFLEASRKLGLEPEELLCIGDNFDNDIVPAAKLGMKAMHIEEAWKLFNTG